MLENILEGDRSGLDVSRPEAQDENYKCDTDDISRSCEHIQFTKVMCDLLARFSRTYSTDIDNEIKSALESIASYACADRSVVWQFEENGAGLLQSYEWYHSGFRPYSNEMLIEGFRWGRQQLKHGNTLAFQSVNLLPPEACGDRKVFAETHHTAVTGVPLAIGGRVIGALCVYGHDPALYFRLPRWRFFGDVIANALMHRQNEASLNVLGKELGALRQQSESDNLYFQEDTRSTRGGELIGETECFKKVLRLVGRVSQTDATVLISGETGTGKELVARAIHRMSARKNAPFIKINCAVLPASLIESELFGHDAGAFTGATTSKVGRFEAADGGSIFLDEIGELPLELQPKLLRVLQEKEFERLGSVMTRKTNVRVIAATNVDLAKAVSEGHFRSDLYYRLNVIPVHCPSLRERSEDIPLLVEHFVRLFNEKSGRAITCISKNAMLTLLSYPWPGNVRELKNVIERAVVMSSRPSLTAQDIFPDEHELSRATGFVTLQEEEREYILRVLKMVNWRVSGPRGAGAVLGINAKTLESKMKRLGIARPVYISSR